MPGWIFNLHHFTQEPGKHPPFHIAISMLVLLQNFETMAISHSFITVWKIQAAFCLDFPLSHSKRGFVFNVPICTCCYFTSSVIKTGTPSLPNSVENQGKILPWFSTVLKNFQQWFIHKLIIFQLTHFISLYNLEKVHVLTNLWKRRS